MISAFDPQAIAHERQVCGIRRPDRGSIEVELLLRKNGSQHPLQCNRRLTTNFNGYQEPTSSASITSSTNNLGSIWTFDYLLVSSVDLP